MTLRKVQAATDITSIETLPTTESLQQLLEQLQETRKLQKALKTTISRNSAVIEKLKSLTATQVDPSSDLQTMPGPLAFLAHSHSASHLGLSSSIGGFVSEKKAIPLSTNVSFALSQLPALQTLLNQLRPILGELSVSADLPAMEADIAKERRYYLETQSRLAMERQGISTGNQTSELLGRIPSTDELAALEEMVDAIND
jgi:kinetochore protein Mis12/MTW1